MVWKRGVRGIMSQKVPGHGKYADIRLTDEELEQADRFIKERWGLDSDIYRWFWIGIESCSRFEALYSMNLEYTRHTGKTGKTTYIMTAFESKTKHIKNGKLLNSKSTSAQYGVVSVSGNCEPDITGSPLGGLVVFILLIVGIVLLVKRYRKKKTNKESPP